MILRPAPRKCAGTEDGHVSAWDLRSAAKSWEQPLSQDYVGGLQLTPDGSYAVVAAADGNLFLLDLRRGGVPLSCVACGPPLRCVATDGELALAGAEDGTVRGGKLGVGALVHRPACWWLAAGAWPGC